MTSKYHLPRKIHISVDIYWVMMLEQEFNRSGTTTVYVTSLRTLNTAISEYW